MAKELGMLFIFLWGYNNKQTKKKKITPHTQRRISDTDIYGIQILKYLTVHRICLSIPELD